MRRAQRLPADPVKEVTLTVRDQKLGTITLLEENRTPPGAVVESLNAVQIQDGVWTPKWGSAYYSTALPSVRQGSAAVTTNLMTNPSFEGGTGGWASVSGATIGIDSSQHFSGSNSLHVGKTGATLQGVTSPTTANVTQNVFYTGSMYVLAPAGVAMALAILHNGVVVQTANITGTGAWARFSVVGLTAAVAAGLQLKLTWSTADTVWIDAVQIELGHAYTDYFDGGLANTGSDDYAWTGTANASTSTRSRYAYSSYAHDGAFSVVNPDTTTEILEVSGGALYRSTNGGIKTAVTITGGALTAGYQCYFLQIHSYVYIGNGHDPIVRYDTNAKTAQGYTALGTPAAPTLASTGLTGSTYTYYYVVVAANAVGTTIGSAEASIQVGKLRDNWATATGKVTLTITRLTGATRYDLFIADQSGFELYFASVADPGSGTTFTFDDDASGPVNEFVELPNDNTTGGPKLTQMELSDNRIFGLDGANPWRLNWAGVGQYTGFFSPFYGGGYVDLEKGGRERPTAVVHYKDGKGVAVATVFTTDPEGNGSTWQVALDSVTVGTTSFLVPNPVKIVGSIGCTSPLGFAKVGNDVVYGNRKGAYDLGSLPSVLNVLSTTELSSLVRPSWRALTGSAMSKLAMYYFDAKIFMAVPAGGANSNSEIWIRNTEMRNWQLGWQGVAIQRIFEYADSAGNTHLIGVPVNGSQLIEFSPLIKGDFGKPFLTRLKTGILPIDPRNHNHFAHIAQLFLELGKPTGTTNLEMYGYDYQKGFIPLATIKVVANTTGNVGWGAPWSTVQWSKVVTIPKQVAQSVARKYRSMSKLLNNVQFILTTSGTSLDDYFEWLEAMVAGTVADVYPPTQWKQGNSAPSVDRMVLNALLDEAGGTITDENGDPLLG